MAEIERKDLHSAFPELQLKSRVIDAHLEDIFEDCTRKFEKASEILRGKVDEMKKEKEDLVREINGLLTNFFEGNIQDEAMAGLMEQIEELKKMGDQLTERGNQLIKDWDLVVGWIEMSRIQSTRKRNREEEEEETMEFGVKDVAIKRYGYSAEIAMHMDASKGLRKLVQNELVLQEDESWQRDRRKRIMAEFFGEDADAEAAAEAGEKDWDKFKILGKKFDELKEEIHKKEKIMAEFFGEDEEIVIMRNSFLAVIRKWIFHVESVFMDLMYELYYMLIGNEISEVIFEKFKDEVKRQMSAAGGLVPISVHKIVQMMENPVGLTVSAGAGSCPESLPEKLKLNAVMGQVRKIIFLLNRALATYSDVRVSSNRKLYEYEVAAIEKALKKSEQQLRKMKRNINLGKVSEVAVKLHLN